MTQSFHEPGSDQLGILVADPFLKLKSLCLLWQQVFCHRCKWLNQYVWAKSLKRHKCFLYMSAEGGMTAVSVEETNMGAKRHHRCMLDEHPTRQFCWQSELVQIESPPVFKKNWLAIIFFSCWNCKHKKPIMGNFSWNVCMTMLWVSHHSRQWRRC